MGGQGTQTYMDRNEICTLYNCPFGAGGSQETLLSSLNASVHVLHGTSKDRKTAHTGCVKLIEACRARV